MEEEEDKAFQSFVEKMNKDVKKKGNGATRENKEGVKGFPCIEEEEEDPIERLQSMGLVNGKDHKSLKFREPSDIQQRDQKTKKRSKKKEPLGPLNVLTRREDQNEYTLQACNKRKGEFPPLQEEISNRTLSNNEYKVNTFPIEDMMIHRFMPCYSYNIRDILCTASNELYQQALIINNKNTTLAENKIKENNNNNMAIVAATPKKRKTKHGDVSGGVSASEPMQYDEEMTVKSVSQFSWDIPNYGSSSANGKAEMFEKVRAFYADCMERMNKFFINDQLEPIDPNVPPQHRFPRSFAIYNEMERTFTARYQERLSVLRDSASRIPKFDDEPPVSKQWIDSYRLRPLSTDELCSRGASCRFNMGKKDAMRYIGRVFETPREVKEKNIIGGYVRNKKRYCIDCLLDCWTNGTYEDVASECAPLVQRNYFTVLCESGQYNETCMIPTMMNERPTGITGFVPAYNQNKRISVPIKIQQIEGNNFYYIATNYLAETGMDFQ